MSKHRNRKQRRRRFHRQTQPGAAPGVVAVHPSAPPSVVRAISYGADTFETFVIENVDGLNDLPRSPERILWVDVQGLGDAAMINALGQQFQLHPLALEDVVNVHQHVKVEDYRDHLFLVARNVDAESAGETQQISMFVGADFVISFQEDTGDHLAAVRERLKDVRNRIRFGGADFLAYSMLDLIVDRYFPILEHHGDRLDELEDLITDNPPRGIVREVHVIRNSLRNLRRVAWQHREMIRVLLHEPTELIAADTRTFLRDCHDHTMQLVDLLEIYRETCSDLRDVYLSAISNRMNEIMMVLTIMATLFIPLGFIASLYGMNFNTQTSPWNMPELNWFFGYPFAIGVMICVTTGLLAFFWHRGWIWQREPPIDD